MSRIAYLQDREFQKKLHQDACVLLSRLDANTNPINYKLAYEYCIGENSAIVEAVNGLIETKQPLSDMTAIRLSHEIFGKSEHDSEQRHIELTNSIINIFDNIGKNVETQREWIDKLNDPDADSVYLHRIITKLIGQVDEKIQTSIDDFKRIRIMGVQNKPLVYTDILTRLKNKLHMDQMMPELIRLKGESSVSIAYFDVDFFGEFNKKHGVHMADSLLRAYAKTLDEFRAKNNGYAWRVGSDEFMLAVVARSEAESLEKIESLHQKLKSIRFEKKKISPEGISMTYGVVKQDFNNYFISLKANMMRQKNTGNSLRV